MGDGKYAVGRLDEIVTAIERRFDRCGGLRRERVLLFLVPTSHGLCKNCGWSDGEDEVGRVVQLGWESWIVDGSFRKKRAAIFSLAAMLKLESGFLFSNNYT